MANYLYVVGRLCMLTESEEAIQVRERCGNLDDYLGNLNTSCREGQPGSIVWTPDENTPSLVYYQV